ncbi:hypothetical protein [Nocardia asteroides]|uniref:hypothetical protein n=1 Tax=Nocardia asteroides TaxID=1824 RepID=UPI0034286CCC
MTTNPPLPSGSIFLDRIAAARAEIGNSRTTAVNPAPPLFSEQRHSAATPPVDVPVPGNELPTFLAAQQPESGQTRPW